MKAKFTRELFCSYIYADGTLAQWFWERRDGEKIGETAEVTLGWCDIAIYPGYKSRYSAGKSNGRVILSRSDDALLALTKRAKVEAIAPSMDGGSESSRQMGVAVGYFNVQTKLGKLSWTVLGSMLSGVVTIQPDSDPLPDWTSGRWNDTKIVKVTDLRPKESLLDKGVA